MIVKCQNELLKCDKNDIMLVKGVSCMYEEFKECDCGKKLIDIVIVVYYVIFLFFSWLKNYYF